jgi:serine/threonine-protein kinase
MSDSSTSGPAPPSYLLEGRYLAEALIARGETADVFSGTDTWSGEQIAIRILRADRKDREAAFRRMSERLFGAASARLLRAIHLGEDRDGRPFLVTERVVGRDVESLGRVRWEVACEITRQAAAVLAEMHLSGLHHGSLRASSLFVAASSAGGSRVKLLDLGTGDRKATAAKDVIALAGILHRLLVGRPPLPAKARGTSALKLNVPGAPPAVEQAVGRWLALPEEGESITAADVATELKAIVDAWSGEAQAAPPPPGAVTGGPRMLPKSSVLFFDDEDDE